MAHNHDHNHHHSSNKRALIISFGLIASYMVIEFIGGIITNSLALLSDAGHMLSDAVALGLSLSALIWGNKKPTHSKTFGYKRFEILAAFINGLILVLLSLYIFKEAIVRISQPIEVMGNGMIIISTIGLIINIIVAWVLSRGEAKENLNIKSALMHVIGDLLGSVGAIIAAILIILFNWNIADPIASIIVSILVLYSGWNILKEAINILMETKPKHIDSVALIAEIKTIPNIIEIYDLHIWMITPEFQSLTAHIIVDNKADRDLILMQTRNVIQKLTGIKHITLQIEGEFFSSPEEYCN